MYWAAVPAPVTASIPAWVIGELATVNAAGIDKPTLVTPWAATLTHCVPVAVELSSCPAVPGWLLES